MTNILSIIACHISTKLFYIRCIHQGALVLDIETKETEMNESEEGYWMEVFVTNCDMNEACAVDWKHCIIYHLKCIIYNSINLNSNSVAATTWY